MADRVIPLRPGPKATLGPKFEIKIDRNKIALNHLDSFKRETKIIEYLMEIGQETAGIEITHYKLPDLVPKKFNQKIHTNLKKNYDRFHIRTRQNKS
jgi:nitrate/nitrite transport system ATP-binding protein